MADKRITDLPAIGLQLPTDLKEVSANGTGSFKETRAEDLAYVQSNTTTDNIAQGTDNLYLSIDAKGTDNLVGCPNFDDLAAQVDGLDTEITDHIADVSNPHETTLQQAYDQNNVTTIGNSTPLYYQDTSGLQLASLTTKGYQNHMPIYHMGNGETLNLSSQTIDTLYCNDTAASGSNTINLQLEGADLYAQNATISVWRNGARPLSVVSPSGVTINGINNATIALNADQYIKFMRMNINEWVSITTTSVGGVSSLNSLTGALNITSPDSSITVTTSGSDVQLELTGSGTSVGYGSYLGRNNVTGNLSFTDTTTWKLIDLPLQLDAVENNIDVGTDAYGTYARNTGATSASYAFTFVLYLARASNTTANGYYMSPFISNDGVSAPTIYNGSNDIAPFGVRTQNTSPTDNSGYVPIVYTNLLTIPAGGKIYMAIQNRGSTTVANNNLSTDTGMFIISKVGAIGGTAPGVVSLNGEEGNIGAISSDNSLTINTTSEQLDFLVNTLYGNYTPTLTILGGATTATLSNMFYEANKSAPTGIVKVALSFSVHSDNSGNIVQLSVTVPFTAIFTGLNQAWKNGFSIIATSKLVSAGAIGDGCYHALNAGLGNSAILLFFETAELDTDYNVEVAFAYQIQ